MTVLYTAQAHVTGGRVDGHGRTSDGNLEVDIRQPKDLGGEGGGTNPEQLFAVGYAACFASALGRVARRRHMTAENVSVDSKVMLFPASNGSFKLGVELDVSVPSITDPEQAADLVRGAHDLCPYSNATRGNIDVALTVNGNPL
ncbi:peroxiredoxin, Ohr subfamily [Nonomuraea maritima]|uniref:Peroxiredoxin, Ohr subfamily n=1 Tax=Nonomuraea maritima TaxID=683260 RepID=A0A1G9N231_9ACTN|nr:organic hydroperoxide resistance protein [Nonomuraea maritima]SDL80321.1 peroxiredoxin, Ohr subfamily [Nonomuraea maritima]